MLASDTTGILLGIVTFAYYVFLILLQILINARANLLKEVREQILEARKKYDTALEKLEYKIGRYEIAQKTGVLTWE